MQVMCNRGAGRDRHSGDKKGRPRGIYPGAFYLIAAAPDGQPVGGVRSAAPGYHYTLDHLLPLGPPRPPPGTVRRRRALVRRATVARHDWIMIRTWRCRNQPPPTCLVRARPGPHNTPTTTGIIFLARKDVPMFGSLSLAAALALSPTQAGGL